MHHLEIFPGIVPAIAIAYFSAMYISEYEMVPGRQIRGAHDFPVILLEVSNWVVSAKSVDFQLFPEESVTGFISGIALLTNVYGITFATFNCPNEGLLKEYFVVGTCIPADTIGTQNAIVRQMPGMIPFFDSCGSLFTET